MCLLRKIVVAGLFLVTPLTVSAQDEAAAEQSAETGRLPYEVIVTPGITRADLRALILEVEEDFFARFNEINTDDEFDIACYKYTPTMSHITERVCEPWFMIRARDLNASEVTFGLGSYGGRTGTAFLGGQRSVFAMPPETMRREKKPEYEDLQKMMEEFTRTDLEFRSIATALLDLRAQLENFGKDD